MSMLDGRICIVTGAAGSLGLASAARFAAEGAKVMLVDRDRPTLDAALKSLPKVNLKGSFLACKHALPRMRDGGSIIMTSSVVGVTSDPGIAAYAASKHGLIGLMRTVAKEVASRRIRVNVVAPGPIDNDFQRNVESGLSQALGTDAGKFLDSVIPLGRHAKAEEVAETVLFLASDKSAFTTGSVVMADGGMHI
jgi:NAD(P)-dependent dehydrogenase (short-subunit alcohol dehydrogenase family)